MVRKAIGILAVIGMSFSAVAVEAQMPVDPAVGTWRFNVERSVWTPGPRAPADAYELRSYTALENGWYRYMSTGRNNAGNPTFQIGVYRLDGRQYPVHSVASLTTEMVDRTRSPLTRSYRVIDENTIEMINYTNGEGGAPFFRQVFADGNTFIQVTEGTNAAGVEFRNVLVYDRVN